MVTDDKIDQFLSQSPVQMISSRSESIVTKKLGQESILLHMMK